MTLVPFTGLVDQDALNENFDDKTAAITAQARRGQKDFCVFRRVVGLTSGTPLPLRIEDFSCGDDYDLRVLRVRCVDTATGRAVTARLLTADGDTAALIEQDVSVSVQSLNGTSQASLDCRSPSQARRIMLFRGGRFRLQLEATGTVVEAQVTAVLRSRRRRR